MRDRVFVSYRRSDTRPSTNAVRQTLERGLGRDAVFVDVTGIPFGAPFPVELRRELDRAAVIVVVMGLGWLDARDAVSGHRRLDDPGDWVHAELIYGLSTVGVTVVPVRVDDADWPAADDLPASLRALAVLNAATVSHDRWDNDWEPLLDRIAALVCRERADKADRTPAAPADGARRGNVHLAEGATIEGHVVTNPNVGGDLNLD